MATPNPTIADLLGRTDADAMPTAQAAQVIFSNISAKSLRDEIIACLHQNPLSPGYFHSNGFLKIELARGLTNQTRLRLHIWNSDFPTTQPQEAHNHAFEYSSLILRGSFRNTIYKARSGTDFFRYIYSRQMKFDRDDYFVTPNGTRNLITTHEFDLKIGDCYDFQPEFIHTFNPLKQEVGITLVVSRPLNNTLDSEIFSKVSDLNTRPRNSRLLTAEALKSILLQML